MQASHPALAVLTAERWVHAACLPPCGHDIVYILRCADGSLYTGYTRDLRQRLRMHQQGKGGYYTRAHLPVTLVGYWMLDSRRVALRAEYAFKQLSRGQKLACLARLDASVAAIF